MKKTFIFILVFVISVSFSSCMMMMPGHMSASMHEGHNHEHSTAKVDPVCGKDVDNSSNFTFEYQGNNYYFESEQCLTVFQKDPDHFVQKQHKDRHRKTMTTVGWIGGGVVMTALMILMMSSIF